MALVSDHVGVARNQLSAWMNSQQITGSFRLRIGDDGRVGGTMCFLKAKDGDLNRSYRATSD
jgi:hypothetical protein